MEPQIVNPDPKYSKVKLIELTTLGYIHVAAELIGLSRSYRGWTCSCRVRRLSSPAAVVDYPVEGRAAWERDQLPAPLLCRAALDEIRWGDQEARAGKEHSVADLEYWVENGVGTILLNRPERKNAFTTEMLDEWSEILVEARTDGSVGAIVLTGAGDAFCSGGEFEELSPDAEGEPTPYDRKAFLTDHVHRIAYALEDLDKPVIAAINGVAVGAGLDFALMCDMRFMARSARISEGYIKVGLVPGDGGAYYLPRLVGTAKALELLLTGDFVDAEEAHRIGMVNRIYEDGELMEETRAFAEKLAAGPPSVTRMIKRAVYQSARSDLRTSLDLISSHMGIVQSMEESHEAFNAFREKRAPRFESR